MLRRFALVLLVVAGCERPCARHSDCPQGESCSALSVCMVPDVDAALPDATSALVVDAPVVDAAESDAPVDAPVDAPSDAPVDAADVDAAE